jgi:hypothetical protein
MLLSSWWNPFGLRYQNINMCLNLCMLYSLENAESTKYRTCRHSRYKPRTNKERTLIAYKKLRYFQITPRLQRLFMSPETAKHMTWHQSHDVVDGVMVHPFDGEAWKYFNSVHSQFSVKSRNVQLELYINGFNLFRSFTTPYSCWSVILTVYNLPPGMCMRLEFMFLSTVIPSPNSLGQNIDFIFDRWLMRWNSCGHLGL